MASSADVVWLDVLPSMKDFLKNLRNSSVRDARTAGDESGRAYSQSFREQAMAGVQKAAADVAAARKKEADAAGAVTVAEQRLAAVREASTASSGRLTAAEESVAKAKRNVEAANGAVSAAEARLNSVRSSGTATQIAAAEERVSSAKRRAADAAGSVSVAEARLSDVRASGSGAASKIAVAEETVARAKRNAATAADGTTRATKNLESAQRTAGSTSARLGHEVGAAGAALKSMGLDIDHIGRQSRGLAQGFSLVGTTVKAAFASLAGTGAAGGLLAVASAAAAATGALALLPAAAFAGGAGLATLALGTMGLGDAFKAANAAANVSSASIQTAANKQQAAAKAVESAQRGVVTASRGVEDAQRGVSDAMRGVADAEQSLADARAQGGRDAQAAARAVEDASRGVVQAQRGVVDAEENLRDVRRQAARDAEQGARQVESAQRGVTTAERALASAQADSQRAQEDLTRARRDAAEQMEDLSLSVRGGALAERQAVLDLAEAQKELNNMPAGTSGADREQLILNLEQAKLRLDEVRERNGDLIVEQAQWARTGVEGSQQVVDAQGRVVSAQQAVGDATQGVSDAQRALADARVAQSDQALASNRAISAAELGVADAVQTVHDAQQNLADARVAQSQQQQDSARAISDAERGVSDALRGVEDAQRNVAVAQENLSTAERDLAQAMEEASSASAGQTAEAQKLADALARLAPNARAFVEAVMALRPAFDNMQLAVQDALFAGLGDRLREIATNYLPVLTTGFVGIADVINAAAHSVLDFVNRSSTINDISTMLGLVRQSFDNLRPAIEPLLQIFLDLAAVGSTFLPGLMTQITNATIGISEFVSQARATGELAAFIQRAIDVITLLGEILWNVGGILTAVFTAGYDQGNTFLHVIEQVTGELSNFLNSPVGQSQLADFFGAIGAAVTALAPLLKIVGEIIFSTIVPALSGLAVQLAPIANQLLLAFNDALIRISPILPILGEAVIALVEAFLPWIPVLAELVVTYLPPLLGLIITLAPAIPGLTIAVLGLVGAFKALQVIDTVISSFRLLAFALPLTPILLAAAAVAALTAGFIIAYQNSETFRNLVSGAFNSVRDAVSGALSALSGFFGMLGGLITDAWENSIKPAIDGMSDHFESIKTNLQALWDAIQPLVMAIGTIVGVVIGIVVGLAVGIFNGLLSAIGPAIEMIMGFLDGIIQAIAGVAQVVMGIIMGDWMMAWEGAKNIVIGAWNAIWAVIEGVVTMIASFIGGFVTGIVSFFQWLYDVLVGHSIVPDLVNSIFGLFQWLGSVVSGAVQGMAWFVQAVWTGMQIAWQAVADFFIWVYNTLIQPLWNALQAAAMFMWNNVLRPTWDAIMGGFRAVGDFFVWVFDNIIRPLWDGLQNAAMFMWSNVLRPTWDTIMRGFRALGDFFRWVYDNIIQPAWNAVASSLTWLKDRFQDAVNWIRDIWNGIKRVLAIPINFMINTVWNNGIVPAWNAVAKLLPGVGPIEPQRGIPEAATGGQTTSDGVNNYANGGQLRGRWRGPTADNLLGVVDNKAPIKLTPREWIHPVEAVDKYGPRFMRAVQKGAFPEELAQNFQYYADGGQIPGYATGNQIFAVTKAAFPNAKLNSTYRPGDPGYHGRNMAADMGEAGFPGGAGRPYIAAMKRFWYDNFGRTINEIIYTGIGNDRPNVKDGRNFNYNAATNAAHTNHLHVAMAGNIAGAVGAAVVGAGIDLVGDIVADLKRQVADVFAGPARAAVNRIGDRPPPAFNDIPRKMGNTLIDKAVDFFGLKAEEQGASTMSAAGNAVTTGPVVGQVRSAATARGWGAGGQWNALDWIINHESGWNPNAQNPTSTASGLFQHIDSTWRAYRPANAAQYAKMRLAPPSLQGVAGMNYIGARYKDPIGAKAFWAKNHWYAGGGQIPSFHTGGVVPNTGRPDVPAYLAPDERVLTPEQDTYFRRFVDVVENNYGPNAAALVGEMTISMAESDPRVVADEIMHRLDVVRRGGRYS